MVPIKTIQGEQAWLSAYTRETGAALSVKYHKFIHHIDGNLLAGVNMLVRDLALTGRVESVHQLPRPDLPQTALNSTSDEMCTDGNLTVVHLKSCAMPVMQYSWNTPLIPVRPRNRFVRYLRTRVLLYKSDVIRGNIIYSAFDLSRMSIRFLRHRYSTRNDDDSTTHSCPPSRQTLSSRNSHSPNKPDISNNEGPIKHFLSRLLHF